MSDDTPRDGFITRWSRRKAQARSEGAVAVDAAAIGRGTAPGSSTLPAPATRSDAPDSAEAADARATFPAASPMLTDPPSTPQRAVSRPSNAAAEHATPPTFAEVTALTPASDFSRFVARDVDAGVRSAALKKLFADPRFQVMDGLDVYIDDYTRPDPLPASALRRMAQAALLGLGDPPPGTRDATGRAAPVDERDAGAVLEPSAAPDPARTFEPAGPTVPSGAHGDAEATAHEDADLRLQPHDAARCQSAAARARADAPGQS